MRWLVLLLLAACAAAPRPAPRAVESADLAWFRRVSLDLIGRVPRVDEVRGYLATPDRGGVVDRLLRSREHAEHWADVTSDLLVGRQARLRGPKRQLGLRDWLADGFAANRGWDAMVRDVLTASDGPATGFLVVNAGKGNGAARAAGVSARVFLGQSIECAECHDHPYDESIKQGDFLAFAAFFADVKARKDGVVDRPRRREPRFAGIEPRFFGHEVALRGGRRASLARAIVASPDFARAAVRRIFAELVGGEPPAGLIDDFRAGYDQRALLRRIVLSDAYRAQNRVRPLGADQLFASLLTATGLDAPQKRRQRALREILVVFPPSDDDEMAESDAFTGSVAQALLLWNGELTRAGARRAPPDLDTMFLAAYTRWPTDEERAALRGADPEDVFFALLVSTEFLTNH